MGRKHVGRKHGKSARAGKVTDTVKISKLLVVIGLILDHKYNGTEGVNNSIIVFFNF